MSPGPLGAAHGRPGRQFRAAVGEMTKAHLKANAHGYPPMQDPGCLIRAPRIQALKHSGGTNCTITPPPVATLRLFLTSALCSTYKLGGALYLSASAEPQLWRAGGCGLGSRGQRSRTRTSGSNAQRCGVHKDQAWVGLVGFDSGGTRLVGFHSVGIPLDPTALRNVSYPRGYLAVWCQSLDCLKNIRLHFSQLRCLGCQCGCILSRSLFRTQLTK